ncbi:putative ABC transport system permease protein [Asanoa hainanensis]|uniref:Putative ABC transport system permease protein n=1 Tax=Asanoa hainanensis TaxID=560556 RepID=A0A239P0E4_9ACTN|nr:ABC transporter permease [Asanoa hainanensis]SNT60490.1 putative ABC transport system permease protein [Asanoa hainanensis]
MESQATVSPSVTYAAVLVVLVVVAAAVAALARLRVSRALVVASLRAVVQLAAISLLIIAVLRSWGLTVVFVASMLTIAAFTSGGRVGRRSPLVAVPILAGTLPVLALILVTGTVPVTPIAVVPIAGILIGGAMTATSLSGRRALETLRTRHGEYEAALALGFSDRDAALELCRPSAAEALVPALDQTRTVGLVTLPGAFVGVLLGGASPIEAGAAQLLVLVGLLAVETIAAVLTVEIVARGALNS